MKICKKKPQIRIPPPVPINSEYEIISSIDPPSGNKIVLPKGTGHTADLYYDPTNNYVVKTFIRYHEFNIFEREVYWLLYLTYRRYNWCPEILHYDLKSRQIYMTYAGNRITPENYPKDWKQQLESIIRDLESENLTHNDIKEEDLLVHKGKLKLIDYGWMCKNGDFSCNRRFSSKEKPAEIYSDDTAVDRIERYLNGDISWKYYL